MKAPTPKNLGNELDIVKKLVHTFPDSIAVSVEYDYPKLDFVETVDRLAERVMEEFDMNRQKYHFATIFENKEDCARFLASYLYSLAEYCQEWIDDNYYVVDGELYLKNDIEDDDD